MSNFIDLTGQKFGKLTVIKKVEKSKNNRIKWICKCECGNITTNGETHTMMEWSKILNINYSTIRERAKKRTDC